MLIIRRQTIYMYHWHIKLLQSNGKSEGHTNDIKNDHGWNSVSWYFITLDITKNPRSTIIFFYYTSDSLWKLWLVENIQSIHNSLWTWHDICNICCRYCIYHVKLTSYCELIECSRPIRFFIVSLMYNKISYQLVHWP